MAFHTGPSANAGGAANAATDWRGDGMPIFKLDDFLRGTVSNEPIAAALARSSRESALGGSGKQLACTRKACLKVPVSAPRSLSFFDGSLRNPPPICGNPPEANAEPGRYSVCMLENASPRTRGGILIAVALLALVGINAQAVDAAAPKKIGVLLVNHGSRSETWRNSLLSLEDNVRPALMANPAIQGIKTAFMEYTEPAIATRLKEFDAEGFTDVVIVPIFLTVSPHTFDDIPTIIGQKVDPQSLETLKLEKIERYTPKAKVVLAPNLDFPGVLKENILRRARRLVTEPANEGLVLIAYGDETYEKEWTALLAGVADYVKANTGITTYSHGWCGHIARYDPKKTTAAIETVLQTKQKAVVIPVLVALDENFQVKIIGDGIAKVADHSSRVVYRPDAILPDPNLEQWVIRIANQYAGEIAAGRQLAAAPRP